MAKPDPNNKYIRTIPNVNIDVYDVLVAFNVSCPARQHAIKKLLCAGIRGKGDAVQDLRESIQAIERAVELEIERVGSEPYAIRAEGAGMSDDLLNYIKGQIVSEGTLTTRLEAASLEEFGV